MSRSKERTIHMVGHAHIDPTWLWRWTEGYEEVRATFRSALDLMKETPGFKFTASSACFYAWVKACDPAMFEEIRARVREGRWELAGGWWVEPDCNVPGGESFARHGLYSQRFFEREFGVRARVGFNPDSFGHAGTLPQLYAKMGIHFYVYMRPEPVHEMNYPEGTTFWWEANDGTRILACNLQEGYGAGDEVLDHIKRLAACPHLNPGQIHIIGFYGVGNHGGGPTRKAIAGILKAQEDEDLPHVEFSTLHGYFDALLKSTKKSDIPVIAKDLQHHARGCYSVHSEVKRLNRACEHALMAAERFATAAWLLDRHTYPQEPIEQAWKDVLYNQFHDVLAGTSIQSAYEDTRDQLGAARHRAHVVLNEFLQRIARRVDTSPKGNTVMVVNPLPWPVTQTVLAPPITRRTLDVPLHIVDENEVPIASQVVLSERIGSSAFVFTADVPALGYRCYHARSGAKKVKLARPLCGDRSFLENDWWRIEFDPYGGHISRLADKKRKVDALRKGNVLAAIVDSSDTWSHGYSEFRVEAGRFGNAALDLLEIGDVRATVRIVSSFNKSSAEQLVTLYRDVDTIDCRFRINWQERYTMLKLVYETTIESGEATYDTAYGIQVRDTRGGEEPGQKWVDLTGKVGGVAYGLAVLNDGQYGFDVRNGIVRVTLLRSPAYAHHDPTRYDASLPYAIMDQGWHSAAIRLVPHAKGWEKAGVVKKAWELNEPAFTHVESAHSGDLPASASFLKADAENVLLSVLKRSEDGHAIIVRGYETAGRRAKTTLELPRVRKSFAVTFRPHEIKTVRIDTKTWQLKEVNLLEE